MKSKASLIIGSIILILGGGFLAGVGFFELESIPLTYYGCTLLFIGILGLNGALLAKQKKAGYFFIILGIAILLPIALTVIHIGDEGGDTGAAALCLGLPALIVTMLWCKAGIKNINA